MITKSNENNIEINLDEYTKVELIALINYAHRNNLTFNEAIVNVIKSFLNTEDENQLPLL